jgi:hypothetical protein
MYLRENKGRNLKDQITMPPKTLVLFTRRSEGLKGKDRKTTWHNPKKQSAIKSKHGSAACFGSTLPLGLGPSIIGPSKAQQNRAKQKNAPRGGQEQNKKQEY